MLFYVILGPRLKLWAVGRWPSTLKLEQNLLLQQTYICISQTEVVQLGILAVVHADQTLDLQTSTPQLGGHSMHEHGSHVRFLSSRVSDAAGSAAVRPPHMDPEHERLNGWRPAERPNATIMKPWKSRLFRPG